MSHDAFMFIWGVLLGYIVNDIITGILSLVHDRNRGEQMVTILKQMEQHAKEKDGTTKS